MGFNRKARRQQEKSLTMEEKAKEALARQYIGRMNAVQMKIRTRWIEVLDKNLHPAAKWISVNIPPKWYINAMFFALMTLPRMFTIWISKFGLPLTAVALIRLPISLVTGILALILLKPFSWFRGYMGHFGIQLRINKLEKFVVQHEIFKFGKVIDEERWEI